MIPEMVNACGQGCTAAREKHVATQKQQHNTAERVSGESGANSIINSQTLFLSQAVIP